MKNQNTFDVFGNCHRISATTVFRAFSPKGRMFTKRVKTSCDEAFDFPFAVFGIVSVAAGREKMRDTSTTQVRFCRNQNEVAKATNSFTAKGCDVVVTTKTSTW
jgi:hypothetical protein